MDTELNRVAPADPAMERAALAHRVARADPASRDTSAMEPQVEDPEKGPGEAAVDVSRVNDSPTRETLQADAISTGVDSGVMPSAMMEQMAWDASVMPISTETDAAVMPIAMVAVTTEQSRWPSSTGVGTDMHASTRALEDDGARSSGTETGEAQWETAPASSGVDRKRTYRMGSRYRT
jgi:hypothetical protein